MASSIPKPRASITTAQGMSPVMKVPLGSRVVLSRRRNGTVRYVGKLANESGEWYGVALDEPKGDCDGMRGKERYFYCPSNHGIFVRRKEIYCAKEPGTVLKGPPSPITDEGSSSSSNASTDQQGELYGIMHPASTNTNDLASPLMKTFKGFRKQLDFISLKTVGPGRSREASPVVSPTSSTPSSPTARSGLKPPSPFRRFASFSQGLPPPLSPGSPTNKTPAASPDNRRRGSVISTTTKTSPVRRTNSFRMSILDSDEDSIRPIATTLSTSSSPNRFNSFQYPATEHFSIAEHDTIVPTCSEASTPTQAPLSEPPTIVDSHNNEVQSSIEESTIGMIQPAIPVEDDLASESETPPNQSECFIIHPIETSSPVEIDTATLAKDQDSATYTTVDKSRVAAFRVPPIDTSALAGSREIGATKFSPASSPRDLFADCSRSSTRSPIQEAMSEVTQTIRSERTRSTGRSNSFRISSIEGSPTSSPESSPSRRSTSLTALLFDGITVLDDNREDSQSSPTTPWNYVSEVAVASTHEPQAAGEPSQRSLRTRQELTAVESLSPDKKLVESEPGSGERPLFFRRMNVGRSPMERRSSYSSYSPTSSSPPRSPATSSTANAGFRSSRVAELEKEIVAMRSSHENIVAVLRATNKQHAANVLELRAQVAALTEGNLWLERQLAAKGELIRELRELEKQQQRDTVSVGEVQKILEIKDTQIQTLEREMAQLRQRLARLESDKDSQLYQQYQHYEVRRARDEKRINELRKEVVAMCNERLELQSEVRDIREMSMQFF